MTYIYGLNGPDGHTRYVGKAQDVNQRLNQHLSPSQLRHKTKKNSWLKNLLAKGHNPELVILSEIDDTLADQEERRIISLLKDCGCDLTNGTDGGDGGAITDPEAKERIRQAHLGRKASEETRKRMSETRKKNLADPAERERMRIRAIEAGCEPPHKKGSEVSNSVFTDELVVYIRKTMRNGGSFKSLSKEIGCTPQAVYLAATGKSWAHIDESVYVPTKRKLTEQEVAEVKSLITEGQLTQKEIAEVYEIDPSVVSRIKNNKRKRK